MASTARRFSPNLSQSTQILCLLRQMLLMALVMGLRAPETRRMAVGLEVSEVKGHVCWIAVTIVQGARCVVQPMGNQARSDLKVFLSRVPSTRSRRPSRRFGHVPIIQGGRCESGLYVIKSRRVNDLELRWTPSEKQSHSFYFVILHISLALLPVKVMLVGIHPSVIQPRPTKSKTAEQAKRPARSSSQNMQPDSGASWLLRRRRRAPSNGEAFPNPRCPNGRGRGRDHHMADSKAKTSLTTLECGHIRPSFGWRGAAPGRCYELTRPVRCWTLGARGTVGVEVQISRVGKAQPSSHWVGIESRGWRGPRASGRALGRSG